MNRNARTQETFTMVPQASSRRSTRGRGKKSLPRRLLTLLATAGLAASAALAAPPGMDYHDASGARVYGGTWYQFHNPSADPTQVIFANAKQGFSVIWDGDGIVHGIQLSPNGQHVAFLETLFEEDVSSATATYSDVVPGTRGKDTVNHYYENTVLHVLTLQGVEVHRDDFVRRFAWHPGGEHLAYITGDFLEGGVGFAPTGVYFYQLKGRGNPWPIHNRALDLTFSPVDQELYLYDPSHASGPVVRFNPKYRQIEGTSRQGIYFSPGGTFYYAPSYDGSGLRLFLTEGDQEITREPGFLDSNRLAYSTPRYWLDDSQLVIDRANSDGDWLLNVDSGQVIEPGGFVLGVDTATKPGNNLRLLTNGTLTSVSQDSLPRSTPTRTSLAAPF
ncbi:MAG: hypothetical protein AAGD01_04860 [Acidobacteriota bacterium]